MSSRTFTLICALGVSLVLNPMLVGCSRKDGSAAGAPSASAQPRGPKIDFTATTHDFGTVTEGADLKHVFTVKNTGVEPLVIDQVRTSCGCTAAAPKTKQIAPGGSGEIEVTFTTKGHPGTSRKTITVTSNDKSKPSATLEIKANVERMLGFEPRYVRVNTDYGVEKVEKVWLVGKLVDQAKLSVTKAEGDKDLAVKTIEEQEGGKLKKGIELRLKGNKVASGNGTLTVATGLPDPAELELRFGYGVAGNLLVTPTKLFFYGAHPTGRERTLRVSSKKPNFKLTQVRVAEGPFKAVIEKPDPSGKFQVKVTMNEPPAGKEAEPKSGKLELISNDAIEPKKVIELSGSPARGPAGVAPGFPSTRVVQFPGGPGAGAPMQPPSQPVVPPPAPVAPSSGAH